MHILKDSDNQPKFSLSHAGKYHCTLGAWEEAKPFLPTIMWLQMSQNVGFLNMCSWKMWVLLLSCWCWTMVGVDVWLSEAESWPVLGLISDSKSTCSFMSLFVRWKKLSALLLRKLLVLKDSDRFSFWSCNVTKHCSNSKAHSMIRFLMTCNSCDLSCIQWT